MPMLHQTMYGAIRRAARWCDQAVLARRYLRDWVPRHMAFVTNQPRKETARDCFQLAYLMHRGAEPTE